MAGRSIQEEMVVITHSYDKEGLPYIPGGGNDNWLDDRGGWEHGNYKCGLGVIRTHKKQEETRGSGV